MPWAAQVTDTKTRPFLTLASGFGPCRLVLLRQHAGDWNEQVAENTQQVGNNTQQVTNKIPTGFLAEHVPSQQVAIKYLQVAIKYLQVTNKRTHGVLGDRIRGRIRARGQAGQAWEAIIIKRN